MLYSPPQKRIPENKNTKNQNQKSAMTITTKPLKRKSLSLYEKGKIVTEAYTAQNNIKPTARKYKVQPHQIREWKIMNLHKLNAQDTKEKQSVQKCATTDVIHSNKTVNVDHNIDLNVGTKELALVCLQNCKSMSKSFHRLPGEADLDMIHKLTFFH
jgi:transposase-like protein